MVVGYLLLTVVPVAAGWLWLTVMHVGPAATRRGGGTGAVWLDRQSAFDSGRWRHLRWSLGMSLTGRGRRVRLAVLDRTGSLRPVGECAVRLAEIVGTVDAGRHPFDSRFDPAADTAWSRFAAVFAAREAGLSLPPVTLYRAGGGYYVLDGHHRVAVARAFGDDTIRADVVLVGD